jgi:hypothetical protein
MITTLNADEMIEMGARLRGPYLLQQAGYTIGIARADGEALAALLPAGYLDAVEAARDAVSAATQDRAVLEDEARELTRAQDAQLQAAKVWRRRVVNRGRRMERMGRRVPELLTAIGAARTVPAVTAQITNMTAALEAQLEAMGGETARPLLDEGRTILTALSQVDAQQESARLTTLPQRVRDYYQAKGTLYIGLKALNDAGRELHSDDPARAVAYNLRILHRRVGGSGPSPAPAA